MRSTMRITTQRGARVLLVSTNRERQPYPVVPNGLACVASALDAAGHSVEFLDLCFAKNAVASARAAASRFRPDVIGVSVRNIDNSDAIALRHYTPEAREVLHALREAAPHQRLRRRRRLLLTARPLVWRPKHSFGTSPSIMQS